MCIINKGEINRHSFHYIQHGIQSLKFFWGKQFLLPLPLHSRCGDAIYHCQRRHRLPQLSTTTTIGVSGSTDDRLWLSWPNDHCVVKDAFVKAPRHSQRLKLWIYLFFCHAWWHVSYPLWQWFWVSRSLFFLFRHAWRTSRFLSGNYSEHWDCSFSFFWCLRQSKIFKVSLSFSLWLLALLSALTTLLSPLRWPVHICFFSLGKDAFC